jgi:hypothetical protein
MENPFNPINKELGSIVFQDGTISVNETYVFNNHIELEDLHDYLKSLNNQKYEMLIHLDRKEIELTYYVNYFQHVELYPEFKIKGDEEE